MKRSNSGLDSFEMYFEELNKPKYIKRSNLTKKQIRRLTIEKALAL